MQLQLLTVLRSDLHDLEQPFHSLSLCAHMSVTGMLLAVTVPKLSILSANAERSVVPQLKLC